MLRWAFFSDSQEFVDVAEEMFSTVIESTTENSVLKATRLAELQTFGDGISGFSEAVEQDWPEDEDKRRLAGI
jgi:hypothetical protein